MYPNDYNLMGKEIDIHFLFKVEELFRKLNYRDQKFQKSGDGNLIYNIILVLKKENIHIFSHRETTFYFSSTWKSLD